MLKKILISISFLALTLVILSQYGYVKYQQKRYRELQVEFGHARAIDAYQRTLEQIDEKGSDYARRAVTIGRTYETVKLEEWQKENNIKLSEHTKTLLEKINNYIKDKDPK